MNDTLIINSQEQLERYLKKYNCKTKEELDDVLWYIYGISLMINIKKHKL
jgi:NTP pyrophosphatase (non-canonical NTP hydrolase)